MQRGAREVELCDVTGKLLPECEWRRVLQMRAADLDDRVERGGLLGERRAQGVERRQHVSRDGERQRHMHRGRDHVVRGLAAVDVVIRVYAASAARLSHQFGGAIGNHLVGVHVGLRSRAGLPDGQREVLVEFSGGNFCRGLGDRISELAVEEAEVAVHAGCGSLDRRNRMNQRQRHGVAARKMMQGALGLGSPQRRRGHFDRPETVAFTARIACRDGHNHLPS